MKYYPALIAAGLLAGCAGSFSIPPTIGDRDRAQETRIETTILRNEQDTCLVRALNFRGFVPMPCEQVGLQPRF